MNLATLKPVASRSPEERSALASKAAKASAKKRRELKAARQVMRELLAMPLNADDPDQLEAVEWLTSLGVKERDQSQLLAMMMALYRRGLKGDVKAVETCLKIAGEWDAEKIEITTGEQKEQVRYRFIDMTVEEGNRLAKEFFDIEDMKRKNREEEEAREARRFERERRMILYRAGILPEDEKKTATEEGDGQAVNEKS